MKKALLKSAWLGLLLAACAESHGIPEPLPDVPRDTRLGELTEEQYREFCDWIELLADGEEYLMCADGSMIGRFDREACYEQRVFYPPECPALLGDAIECRTTKVNACLAGSPPSELLPACERSSTCSEP